MKNARETAFCALNDIYSGGAYSSISVKNTLIKESFSDEREKALAVMLIYGVLEKEIALDYNLSLYLRSPLKKLKNNVLIILRLGAFQILFAEKIPNSAAVNESVKLAKKHGLSYAAGMINAVLRKIAQNGIKYPDKAQNLQYISVRYCVPAELLEHFILDYGEENAVKIISSFEGKRPVYIRLNTVKADKETLFEELQEDGAFICDTKLENCFEIRDTGDITALHAYKKGYFHVQDMSSQLCCKMLDAKKGNTVLDCCAAPGGKSFTVSQYMENSGVIYSCDIHPHKTRLIEEGASRLGLSNIKTVCCDARNLYENAEKADKVLCDVPCSGFGVIGRKPEIRHKNLSEISSLPKLQLDILTKCSAAVKDGGVLIYSTCTLNKKENDYLCDEFLENNPDFHIAQDAEYKALSNGKYITVFPSENGGDGFFIAKFIRGKI